MANRLRPVVPALLACHAALLAYAATGDSATINEPAHLIAGIGICTSARFDLYPVNPPLPRVCAALPVLFAADDICAESFAARPRLPAETIARAFVERNGEAAFERYVVYARFACIPFSVLGGYLVYRWAASVYNSTAGLIALLLWCADPTILGHGHLITGDVPAATMAVAAAYAFRRALHEQTLVRSGIAGIALGIALLTKFTLLLSLPLWVAAWCGQACCQRRASQSLAGHAASLIRLLTILAAALYVVNLGYGFKGSCRPLGAYAFRSTLLGGAPEAVLRNRFTTGMPENLPVPLPEDYVRGMDEQRRDFEEFPAPSYLRGRFQARGWWYYYLYGLAIKVPCGTWILAMTVVIRASFARMPSASTAESALVVAIGVAVVVGVSSQDGFSHHFRYVLPAFPFGFLWASQAAYGVDASRSGRTIGLVTCVACVATVVSALSVFPHGLSYCNECAGGTIHGDRHLIMSSYDWGQDRKYLRGWSTAQHAPFWLACYKPAPLRRADMSALGPPPQWRKPMRAVEVPAGWYAVSANYVAGYPWEWPMNAFAYFQSLRPAARCGYSIYVYHVQEAVRIPVSELDGCAIDRPWRGSG